MRQSVRIMKQCIEKLRRRPARGLSSPRIARSCHPRRAEMKRSMEALIHHFKLLHRRFSCAGGRSLLRRRGAEGRVRRVSRLGRHQQALSLQDPGAGLRAPAAMDFLSRKATCSPM